jgi:hypothetical protein
MNQPHAYGGPVSPPDTGGDEREWEDEPGQLPPRRVRRWRVLSPTTGVLFAVLLAALGFIAGALVERTKAGSASGQGGSAGRAGAGFGGRTPGGGALPPGAVVGQVANLSGRTIYLTDAQGNTVKVRVPKGATVTRTSSAGFSSIPPGDAVVVQGATAGNGTVTAGSVRATAASLSAGSALSALFGGGGGRQSSGGGQQGGGAAGGGPPAGP